MTVVRWEDPPPMQWGRWKIVQRELEQKPGTWALIVDEKTRAKVDSAKAGLKAKGCETSVRKNPNGTFSLWARWPK